MFDFLKNKDGSFSMTRIGAAIVSIAGIVLALPTAGVSVPVAVLVGAKIVGIVSATISANGLRNAIDNK